MYSKRDKIQGLYLTRCMLQTMDLTNVLPALEDCAPYCKKFLKENLNKTPSELLYAFSLFDELSLIHDEYASGVDPYITLSKVSYYSQHSDTICMLMFKGGKTFCVGEHYVIDASNGYYEETVNPANIFQDNVLEFKAIYLQKKKRNETKFNDNKKRFY